MRILHTSDWHLGRSFHGYSLVDHTRQVLAALTEMVRREKVDVVLIAGDVFDHANPAAVQYQILEEQLLALRQAGAAVIAISGNHDNPLRLGFQSTWAARSNVHIITAKDGFRHPITIPDAHGQVDFYGIAYLEPRQSTALYAGAHCESQQALLTAVTAEIRELAAQRGNRAVVLAHCFAVASGQQEHPKEAAGLHRDITAGGIDYVDAANFAGFSYAALGHLHGRQTLAPHVRYSGAPVYFSFGEVHRERGVWLVDLDAAGVSEVTWHALPVPRPLTRLRGTLEELLQLPGSDDWVEATLTDAVLPAEPMRQLQQIFPFCAALRHEPPEQQLASDAVSSYRERIAEKTPLQVAEGFLEFVRAGQPASELERELLAAAQTEDQDAN